MNVSPTASGLVTGVVPSLRKAVFVIATSAIGPITWVNESALLEKSGSPVSELIVAVSVAICPSVPAATVAVIVI